MANTTITVPDIGGAEGAEVVEVLVAVGDTIEVEQSLIVLESDKASMEIPATLDGKVTEVKVAVGDQVSEGDTILAVESAEAAEDTKAGAEDDDDNQEPAEQDSGSGGETGSAAASTPESDSPSNASASSTGNGGSITVEIPDIGTDGEVDLVEVAVTVGQRVEEGDSLVVLESDKASMEVPAPASGTITEILIEAGATVSQGDPIMTLDADSVHSVDSVDSVDSVGSVDSEDSAAGAEQGSQGEGTNSQAKSDAADQSQSSKKRGEQQAAVSADTAAASSEEKVGGAKAGSAGEDPSEADVYAGPAVRKLGREFGIDLAKVSGSGPKGRILKEDLHSFVKEALKGGVSTGSPGATSGSGIPVIPEIDFAKFGEVDPQPRSRMDKVTASNMSRSWLNVPHVTQFDDADITDLEDFRASLKSEAEKRGAKITPLPFILKACAVALKSSPKLKTSLADGGETLVYKQYCHIGMAVDTPAGLMVPVIRDVDQKSIWEISAEVYELAGLARDKKLRPDQMQGGVFSVSSLGSIGGRGFTPIVNAPEVAILGVSKASTQPVWDGREFAPRKLLPLSLSYDHRVVNGGDAGRFLTELVGLLSDIRKVMM